MKRIVILVILLIIWGGIVKAENEPEIYYSGYKAWGVSGGLGCVGLSGNMNKHIGDYQGYEGGFDYLYKKMNYSLSGWAGYANINKSFVYNNEIWLESKKDNFSIISIEAGRVYNIRIFDLIPFIGITYNVISPISENENSNRGNKNIVSYSITLGANCDIPIIKRVEKNNAEIIHKLRIKFTICNAGFSQILEGTISKISVMYSWNNVIK